MLGLQTCWYGDLDDAAKGRVGVGRAPPPTGWAPRSRPAAVHGAPRALLGSHGLGAQHGRLQWLERLKLQSTALGDSGADPGELRASPQHGSDKSTAESRDAPAGPGPRRRAAAGLRRAGPGARRPGSEGRR